MDKDNPDYIVILTEVSKFFKLEYYKMLISMKTSDLKILWNVLNGRTK